MRLRSAITLSLLALAATACADAPTVAPATADVHAAHVHGAGVSAARASASTAQLKLYAAIRAATARYHRVEAAEADGYAQGSPCVSSPAGAMGHHYLKMTNVDGTVDPLNPEVLVYLPEENGRLRLVAVEYLVVAAPWDAVHSGPPMLGEQPFDDGRGGNIGGPPFPHYQLHTWLWHHNPAGMHTPFNATLSCPTS